MSSERAPQAKLEAVAELLHKSFLAKVPQVLGQETSAKFFADLPDSYGRARKGYAFSLAVKAHNGAKVVADLVAQSAHESAQQSAQKSAQQSANESAGTLA